MGGFLPNLTPADWAIITAVTLVPLLMVFGIHVIRSEVRKGPRIEAKSVRLKTSRVQRQKWRKEARSGETLDLLDDIEALLHFIHADDALARQEHKEAVRLSWMSYRIPIRMALFGSLLLAGLFSAILMVIAQGPSNPIP